MRYHDFHLHGYTVADFGRKIKLHLVFDYPGSPEGESHIEFTDVACYQFYHTGGSIITAIDEEPLHDFVRKEEAYLVAAIARGGLQFWRSDVDDYLRQLKDGGYHAWRLESAIGFSGFVVAQAVREVKEPNRSQSRSP
jgi:hypothetical protein